MQQRQSKLRLKERFGQMTGYMKSNKPFSYTLALLLVSLFFLGVKTYQNVYNVLMNDDVINEDAIKIEFHDKNLEREVRNLLERPKDDIYDVDVEKISILTIQNVPVKDIQDLKYFKGLSKLTISSAKITDVSALKDIPYLKELDLSSNQIADVTPLGQIKTLQRLTLAGNYIRDMSPLYSLKNLTELNLSGNSIIGVTSDITKLTNLKSLNLSRNRITDNSVFSGMPQLNILNLTSNRIMVAKPLTGMDQLYEYSLESNSLTTIGDLGDLPVLEKLSVASNCLTDINFASKYPWLLELTISLNNISSLEPLKNNTELQVLKMQYTDIKDVSILEKLPQFNSIFLDPEFDRSKIRFLQGRFRNGDLLTKQYLLNEKYGFEETDE